MHTINKRERNIIVTIVTTGSFISILSQTVLTSAMPIMMRDFHVNANIGQWLTTIYLLVLGVMIPCIAYLINRIPTRKLYIAAMGLFFIGCIFSIFSKGIGSMIVSRIIQAIGAGILTQLVQVVILTLYPIENRGAAMGIVGLTVGFAPTLGPALSGLVIDHLGWRSLFYFLAGIAIINIIGAYRLLKDVGERKKDKLDILSFVLSTMGFGGLLLGVTNQGNYGLTAPVTYIPLMIGVSFIIIFILRQIHIPNPLLELRVFNSRKFTVSTLLIGVTYAAMMSATILVPLYVQNMRGFSAFSSGIIMLPGSLLYAVLSPVTGRLLDQYGPRTLCIVGMSFLSIGTFAYSRLGENTMLVYLAIVFALRMIGVVCILSPLRTWGINSLEEKNISHGAAIINTFRQISGAIGSAVLVTVMTTVAKNSKENAMISNIYGVDVSFKIATILTIIGFIGILLYVKETPSKKIFV